MVKNRKIAYGLFLTAALCTASMALSVGESHARYVNRATWYTVAEPAGEVVTSDCLVDANGPPRVILLGQMSREAREIPFTLTSALNRSGDVTWSVDQPEYLDVGLRMGSTELNVGDIIGLSQEVPTTLVLSLSPTEQAAQIVEPLNINIQVTWQESLTATFQVEIPTAPEEEVPTEAEELTEETTTQEDPAEETTIEEDPAEETTTQEEPTGEPADKAVLLESVGAFQTESAFPLSITTEEDMQVRLGIAAEEGVSPFPPGTLFSPDNGENYYMLYQEGEILLDALADTPMLVLLDLSRTTLAQEQTVTISTESGGAVSLTADAAPLYEMSTRILTADAPLVVDVMDTWQGCVLNYSVDMLTAEQTGKAYVPVDLSQGSLTVTDSNEETGQCLILSVGDSVPQPGTYRLNLSWSYNGICFEQTQATFFINYEAQTISEQTGGAEQ